MSGESSKRKKNDPKPTTPEPGPTVQAFMPGMDSMLAQQLSRGGYGQPNDLMGHFQSVYTPMQMPGKIPTSEGAGNTGSSKGIGGGLQDLMDLIENMRVR